ncbi:MAG: hypothetical protein AB7P04_07400 [Bacteriovoracia bacterium]
MRAFVAAICLGTAAFVGSGSTYAEVPPAVMKDCLEGKLPSCLGILKKRWVELQQWQFEQVASKACDLGHTSSCGELLKNMEVRYRRFWKAKQGNPVERPAIDLVKYLRVLNQFQGYSEIPSEAHPPESVRDLVDRAYAQLDPAVHLLLGDALVGIYLMENLGSSAIAVDVWDDRQKVVGGVIALDIGWLNRAANEWATTKENTAFQKEKSYQLKVKLAEAGKNTREAALQYILLHEIGHIIEQTRRLNPPGDRAPRWVKTHRYPYFKLSWMGGHEKYVSRFDRNFPERARLSFYSPKANPPAAKPTLAEATAIYRKLEQTSFPTLYAATHPQDDFAEAFANYVHVVLMKRPYQVTLTKDGKITRELKDCWNARRCREKRKFLEKLFQVLQAPTKK